MGLKATEDLESIRAESWEGDDEEASTRSGLSGGASWTRLPAGSWRLPSVLLGGIGAVSSGRIGSWRIPSINSAVQVPSSEEDEGGSSEVGAVPTENDDGDNLPPWVRRIPSDPPSAMVIRIPPSGEPASATAPGIAPPRAPQQTPMVAMDPIVAHALRQAANIMQVWRYMRCVSLVIA